MTDEIRWGIFVTKRAATDVEQSVEPAIATVLNKLDSVSLKEEQTTALKGFVKKNCCTSDRKWL